MVKLNSLSTAARGAIIVFPWLLYLLGTDILLSLLLPVSFVTPTIAYNVASKLAYGVWYGIQIIFTRFNGACITISGDVLPANESAIVIANHVAWTDFYLIQELAMKAGMLSRCRWFAKQQLKWVPFLGWGLWAMGMPLISRRWDRDQRELDRVFHGPRQYGWPIWLVSYSEATRFTPEKYSETVRWCEAKQKPVPKYCLYPRTKGFVTTVTELSKGSSVEAVYDLTLAYAHNGKFLEAPDMWTTLSRADLYKSWRFHVHVERISLKELSGRSEVELASWLEDRWMMKSKRLEILKEKLEKEESWGSISKQPFNRGAVSKRSD